MTSLEASEVVAALAAAFPRTIISGETLAIYARFLSDIDVTHGITAVATWIAREARWPNISELRDAAERCAGNSAPDLDQAWAELNRAISAGEERRKPWSHPAIRDAVAAVGWREIGQSTEPGVTRAHFQRAYESARRRNADPMHRKLVAAISTDVKSRIEDTLKALGQLKPGVTQPRIIGGNRK